MKRIIIALTATIAACLPVAAKVKIDVDLDAQRMRVSTDSGEQRDWPVSTGREGLDTPAGVYGVTRLDLHHRSKEYSFAPMEFSIFFHDGYAIHAKPPGAGGLGRPASHGCVRLSYENAATLFGWVKREGAEITVEGETPRRIRDSLGSTAGDAASAPPPGRVRDSIWYEGPSDDPAPRSWRRHRANDGFEDDAPSGY